MSKANTADTKESKVEKCMFIEVHGVSPNDIPHVDTALDIANDIHDLLREEYSLDVQGVACDVNLEKARKNDPNDDR